MGLLHRVKTARENLRLAGKMKLAPTQTYYMAAADLELSRLEEELQALAQEVQGNCCNSTGHRCEIISKIGLTNDQS